MPAMFSIPSIQKILVLISILGAVWYGFKLVGRLKEARDEQAKRQGTTPRKSNPWRSRAPASEAQSVEAEDMVECPVCRTYVAAKGARACGKPGCPY